MTCGHMNITIRMAFQAHEQSAPLGVGHMNISVCVKRYVSAGYAG
eukprot:CAMPEP_0202918040 /NCGR_PEP_ID=MMETSP1392-20130828/72514_1 /ASSEMBLY_ACC=CAM_ASM_000868 /TAXON_ID=225041 /ORGANISM="Chlamydomonas chlamydogama, Strain SAG 11-48b" /LENGTH=44 /DNA_ID= /DNA_START= /DNA_END= /DNA_ORIENTATION=